MADTPSQAQVLGSLYLPDVGPSTNLWYSGTHWDTRKKIADFWHELVWVWAKKYHLSTMTVPVALDFTLHFGPKRRAFDASNCSATVKLVEDGLVKAKILRGDGPAHVTAVTMRSKPKQAQTYTLVRFLREAEAE